MMSMKRGWKPKGSDLMGGRCPDRVKSCTCWDLKPKWGFSCVKISHKTTPNAKMSVCSLAMPPLSNAVTAGRTQSSHEGTHLNSSGAIQDGVPTSLLRPCFRTTASPKSATLDACYKALHWQSYQASADE